MSCLTCGADLPRGQIGLCESCGLPKVGRAPSPAEERYRVLRASLPALEARARVEYAEGRGLVPGSREAEQAWLALGPRERAAVRAEVLEAAREAAEAPLPPPPGTRPERVP